MDHTRTPFNDVQRGCIVAGAARVLDVGKGFCIVIASGGEAVKGLFALRDVAVEGGRFKGLTQAFDKG